MKQWQSPTLGTAGMGLILASNRSLVAKEPWVVWVAVLAAAFMWLVVVLMEESND